MNKCISINQALHGYDQGHNLLSSSIQFTLETKRILLLMSDMSGTNMEIGFEECITGYPLKDFNSYALTKTWYAPEMKRPGCVWSHTLLISFSDLGRIGNIGSLLALFKRPPKNHDFASYSSVIEMPQEKEVKYSLNDIINIPSDLTKITLKNLYNSPESPILIRTLNPSRFESLVLSLWMQQWPRLKRNFSFCTAAISPRLLNNQLLDLQLISSKFNRISKKENKIIIEIDDNKTDIDESIEWINFTYNDLIDNKKEFRNFLNYFGADLNRNRDSFIPIVETYLSLRNPNKSTNISDLVKTLSTYFPSSDEASSLKQNILCINKNNISFDLPIFTEEKLLFELATTDYYNSFDFDKLELSLRFKNLFNSNIKSAFNILEFITNTKLNPNGEIAFKAIANIIEDKDIRLINQSYQNLLSVLVYFNNDIAYYKEFWHVSPQRQKELFDSLTKIKSINWQNIFSIFIEINIEIDLDTLSNFQVDLPKYILNWLNQNPNNEISFTWINLLRNKSYEVVNWLKRNPICNSHFYIILPQILNPNSEELTKMDSRIWSKLISGFNKNQENYDNYINLKAFLLAYTLHNPDNCTFNILSFSFDSVYYALLNNRLNYESWKWIEKHTKSLPFWQEWDKCKKMRNLIVDIFIKMNWDIAKIELITSNKSLINELKTRYYNSDKT